MWVPDTPLRMQGGGGHTWSGVECSSWYWERRVQGEGERGRGEKEWMGKTDGREGREERM